MCVYIYIYIERERESERERERARESERERERETVRVYVCVGRYLRLENRGIYEVCGIWHNSDVGNVGPA